jgi:hypothetical protein
MTDQGKDSAEALQEAIDRYNAAWNDHDLASCLASLDQKWRPQITAILRPRSPKWRCHSGSLRP